MTFTPKDWQNEPSIATPVSAAALVDLETRVTDYTDSSVLTETDRAETAEALLAPLASPALTGTPTVPTAAVGTDTTQVASTAFVIGQAGTVTPLVNGTAEVGVSTSFSRQDHVHPTDTSRAPLIPIGTSPGAPTTGSYLQGEQWLDSLGVLYICTVSGTPGTWMCPRGQILATKVYGPSTEQQLGFPSDTWDYPDTTNLAIGPIVIPPSGQVIVSVKGGSIQLNGIAPFYTGVGITGSGTPIWQENLGYATNVLASAGGGGGLFNMPYQAKGLLTGLTPGSSYTFYFALYASGTNGDLYLDGVVAGNGGSALMQVISA